MKAKIIKNDTDYQEALNRLNVLFDAPSGTPESDEADLIALLVEDYESKYYPIDAPDPIEAIKIRMEELQLQQVDLVDIIGGKSRVSEVLNKKRKLTVQMIRNLAEKLHISPSVLIKDYKLSV